MKRTLLPFLLLGTLANCQNTVIVQPAANDIITAQATLQGDMLPVDGCNAHLILSAGQQSSDWPTSVRLPTEKTRPVMEQAIKAELAKDPKTPFWMGRKNVTIRYRETGQIATLQCGWGKQQTVKAIDLLEIK